MTYITESYFKKDLGFDEFYKNNILDKIPENQNEVSLLASSILDDLKNKNNSDIGIQYYKNNLKKTDPKFNLLFKIFSHKLRKGCTATAIDILCKIKTDNFYQSVFMKDPKKQPNEIFQVDYINNQMCSIYNTKLVELKSKKNCHRIKDDGVIGKVPKDSENTKSLDGLVKLAVINKEINIFTIMKVTQTLTEVVDSGGAQANQFELALNDTKAFNANKNPDTYIVYILDGEVWKNNKQVNHAISSNKNAYVYFTTSDGFCAVLDDIIDIETKKQANVIVPPSPSSIPISMGALRLV